MIVKCQFVHTITPTFILKDDLGEFSMVVDKYIVLFLNTDLFFSKFSTFKFLIEQISGIR